MGNHRAKQFITVLLSCTLLFLCTGHSEQEAPTSTPKAVESSDTEYQKYSGTFYDAFDTVTIITGYAQSEEQFNSVFNAAKEMFIRYHKVFDIYSYYEGVNNLYYVNKNAGKGPVNVEPELMALLKWIKEKQILTMGRVNVAMGSVLNIWHDYREEGISVPEKDILLKASNHVNFDDIILDEDAGTVFFADPSLKIDVGAVAKGYTVEIVAQWMLSSEMPSFILSAGGNVYCGEQPRDGRARWGISIQNPDAQTFVTDAGTADYLDVIYTTNQSIVTSGDYQRYYTVDGVRYHHLIDPDTLMPANYMRSVTIVTEDSAMADLLSTVVFLLPYDEGRAFVDSLDGVEAYWVLTDGTIQATDGLLPHLRSRGASSRD